MQVFLFHVCASTECLLGLGVEDSNLQDSITVCEISLAVAHNSPGPEQNIAAQPWGIPLNDTDYLSSQANVQYILF